MTLESTKRGAVLILLYMRDGEPHVVFTKRTNKVAVHKGEVSFPGGAYESSDPSLLDTALRETAEELGVDLRGAIILGRLDDVRTASSNFVVAPFVAFVPSPPAFRPDPFEVEEVFDVPLKSLLDPAVFHEEEWELEGVRGRMSFYRHKGHQIWGATARILKQFLEMYQDKRIGLPTQPAAQNQENHKL